MLRLLIGCLALVGLVTLLVVGGCVGLIAFGVKKAITLPERARAERIEAAHGPLLSELRRRLGQPDGLAGMRPDPALVAIRVHHGDGPGDDKDVDLLRMRPLAWGGYHCVNRGGVGAVEIDGRHRDCLISIIELRDQTYWVYLADPGPGPAPLPAVERP